jgi:hypothetical protein
MMQRWLTLLLAPLLIGAAAAPPPAQLDFSPDRFRAHVAYLADDRLEGRDTGSRGFDLAAAYVADQFKALGLAPAGDNGSWYQQVPLRSARYSKEPSLTLLLPEGRQAVLVNGSHVIIGASALEAKQDITAPVVFAGYGIDAPNLGMHDYQGLDVNGRIVAVLAGAPRELDSETAAYLNEQKGAMAARKGAVGLMTLPTAEWEKAASWESRVRRAAATQMVWIGRGRNEEVRAKATLRHSAAALLFTGAPRSYEAI